ncbi:MAG: LysM peptidoglycan-binding domain-containing protein [Deltaproteobacteria bacterium]|nr:LysM peptidoglycan-binding domain-containing protein [Deltaproteobacteria bacterium]
MNIKISLLLLPLILGCLLFHPSIIHAERLTHLVEKGDTLWDICEKYYGDSELWPKLWQMNPFVTNPHLLTPGDVITLFDTDDIKPIIVKKDESLPVKKTEEPAKTEPAITGVSLEGVTNVKALGFLSFEKINPWGTLFATDSEKIMWAKGDTVFVIFNEGKAVEIGDEFAIGRASSLIRHPITGKDMGYIFSIFGRLVVEEQAGMVQAKAGAYSKKNIFKTKILETYTRAVHIDDVIIPYQPVPSCVQPVSMDQKFEGLIVAAKDELQLIGQHSVVYIDQGSNKGIQQGNLFEIIKKNIVTNPDPKDKSKQLILPDIPIATIIILESRPDTSTAIVIAAKENFSTGISIRGLSWVDPPSVLSYLAGCSIP